MKRTLSIALVLLLSGCATLGLPYFGDDTYRSKDQKALELAALVAVPYYFRIADMEGMSHSEHLRMTVAKANGVIAGVYPGIGTFEEIFQRRVKDITKDKWDPQVAVLYAILYEVLDFFEGEPEAMNHVLDELPLELEPL